MGYLCAQVLPNPHAHWPSDASLRATLCPGVYQSHFLNAQSREEKAALGPCGQYVHCPLPPLSSPLKFSSGLATSTLFLGSSHFTQAA